MSFSVSSRSSVSSVSSDFSSSLRPHSSSPLPFPTPTDDIPTLSLDILTTADDRSRALRLVADSMAQMERRAVRALVLHPLCLALVAVAWVLAGLALGLGLILAALLAAAGVVAVRLATLGYRARARAIDASWLGPDDDDAVVVIGARRGRHLVGALVLRVEPARLPPCSSPRRRGRNRSASLRGGRGMIRAWTTHIHHRERGIGRHLLLAAVQTVKDRCGRDARVGFAKEHANSAVIVPAFFAAPFRRDEARAARALDDVAAEWETTKRKR